jgi:hypothetical protein
LWIGGFHTAGGADPRLMQAIVENGQLGPCLTDATREAALDVPFAKLPLR